MPANSVKINDYLEFIVSDSKMPRLIGKLFELADQFKIAEALNVKERKDC